MRALVWYIGLLVVVLAQTSGQFVRQDLNLPSNVNDHLPTNICPPSILRKYEFEDPNVVFHPREIHDIDETSKDEEDLNYDYAHEADGLLHQRDYNGWLSSNHVAEGKVCETEVCKKTAEAMKSNVDLSADPCHDFDQFACGGWRHRFPLAENASTVTVFTKLWKTGEEVLKTLIERQAHSQDDSSAALLYNWYSSCMNTKQISALGATPLLVLITELESCPLLSQYWSSYAWSHVRSLVELNKIGIRPLFTMLPGSDRQNSSRTLLQLSLSELPLHSVTMYLRPGKYYKAVRLGYLRLMIKLIVKLSSEESKLRLRYDRFFRDAFKYQLLHLYKVEYMLAKARLHQRSTTYQKMSLNRLEREIPQFPWKIYLALLYTKIPQKQPITGDEMIAVHNLDALKRIFRLLWSMSDSQKANYFMWNVVHTFASDLSPDFEAVFKEFVEVMYGKKRRTPRWRECVISTNSALAMAVGKLYVEERFDKKSKGEAAKIIEHVRQQLIKDLKNLPWMDSQTAKKAEEKAHAIVKNIGYPELVLNETLLRMYYTGMSFNRQQFLVNIIRRRIVVVANTLQSREFRPNRKRWSMSPQEVNAYYSPTFNKIVFPAGILQTPFWHPKFTMALQFAGLGFISGHEITHGFDNMGRNYDQNGNYINWWTNSSLQSFLNKTACMAHQYSNYTIFGKHINGNLTLGENIADNAGLRLAYNAYMDWLKENDGETLPGLPFNSKQLFFLQGAQVWCANIRKKSALNSIDTDEHTPKMFRTIGAYSNFPPFSTAFNCPLGSRMNPREKCRVW